MLSWILHYRKRRYVEQLIKRGLRLGPHVYLNDGFFLDPSHCHLITIDEGAIFGPRVTILAHDASSLRIIGKTRIQPVRVGRYAFVGAGAMLLPGSELGDGSILGAGSILRSRVPAGEIWAGNPARRISTVEEYREKLRGLPGRDFPEAQYRMEVLSDARREEMVAEVTFDRPGFMIDIRE
jgi:maltose O-acetyltransferase